MYCKKIPLYENRTDVTLTTYVWDDAADLLNGRKRPAVIICPGGAYLNLAGTEGEPVALAFAGMGYHAFVLRYSVYTEGSETPDMFADMGDAVKEHCVFPGPMRDIGRAMLYLREHSEEWLINTEQIAICGFSAGAHNCAMYSVYWDKPEIAGFFDTDAENLKPAACILGYSLTDYVFQHSPQNPIKDAVSEQLFRQGDLAFLGTKEPSEEMLYKVSPVYHISANTPPVFLWATSEDNLVPVQHSIRMAGALADAKVPFELHIFEKGIHGLGIATEAGAGNLWNVNPEASKWVPMCHAWLKKRFELPLDEKPFWADLTV